MLNKLNDNQRLIAFFASAVIGGLGGGYFITQLAGQKTATYIGGGIALIGIGLAIKSIRIK
ncbi:MAG: hypothetical protein KME30_30295 [Iphinoe sp. HA4291-MV1]|jgi:F0F1-type ATP synthase assembly protein I|nr:hypothetical protein [Iphinoe sp. HA4291-MV1]